MRLSFTRDNAEGGQRDSGFVPQISSASIDALVKSMTDVRTEDDLLLQRFLGQDLSHRAVGIMMSSSCSPRSRTPCPGSTTTTRSGPRTSASS